MTRIVTERLVLRTAEPGDAAAMHAVLSDPRAMTWWSSLPHETLQETEAWLARMIANGPDQPDFVIEKDGLVIGKAGFWKLPDIGYILRPDHWGQGLAGEAVQAVLDHVFAATDLDAVTADVDPDNAASIRLLERLGFRQTGFARNTWCIGGAWKDSVYYGLSRFRREPSPGA
ncbi:GNAT family N-acetyltransferase [Rhizobium sp. CRIBSB]|nr:GNAT family N-acetyltransferase [Rhizobium sp. CRIBSB]